MSGYGFAAGGDGAGDGSPASSYGYSYRLPGGYLDATQGLQGPGTTAYYQDGPYTSYASESERGGIFEQNTVSSDRYVSTSDSYHYQNSSYSYNHHEIDTVFNTPEHYGRAYGGSAPVVETYQSSTGINTYEGADKHVYRTSTTFYAYSDGTYTQHFSSLSRDYVDGTLVPGSTVGSESEVSGYIGGYNPYSS